MHTCVHTCMHDMYMNVYTHGYIPYLVNYCCLYVYVSRDDHLRLYTWWRRSFGEEIDFLLSSHWTPVAFHLGVELHGSFPFCTDMLTGSQTFDIVLTPTHGSSFLEAVTPSKSYTSKRSQASCIERGRVLVSWVFSFLIAVTKYLSGGGKLPEGRMYFGSHPKREPQQHRAHIGRPVEWLSHCVWSSWQRDEYLLSDSFLFYTTSSQPMKRYCICRGSLPP